MITGSEGDTTRRGRGSSRPHTRLTHRRSDSEASSISVSSLSDNEQPERQSQGKASLDQNSLCL